MKRIENYTDEEWVTYLNHQIDEELDKPMEEQDWEWIDECNAMIEEIRNGADAPDPVLKEKKLQELRKAYSSQLKRKNRKLRSVWKIAAACAAVMILAVPGVSSAIHLITPGDILDKWKYEFLNLPRDTPIEDSGITFMVIGEHREYDTIEALIKAESIDVMYPTWLPEGVEIEKISVNIETIGNSIIYDFNNEQVMYGVMLYEEYAALIEDGFAGELHEINGHDFYISGFSTVEAPGYINAIWNENGYSYSLSAKTNEVLYKILESLIYPDER